jgi:hypothetical protein
MIQNGGEPVQIRAQYSDIGTMVREQNQLRAQEMNQIAEHVRIRAGVVEFGESSESVSGKTITVSVQGKEIAVEPGVATVVIRDGELVVNTTEIHLRNGRMYFGENEINQTPEQIRERIRERDPDAETHRFELRESRGKAVYAHETIQQRKLLGLFSMRATLAEEYDAETGELVKEARPWWYAFSTDAE